jgi:predicted ATPase
MRISRGIKRPKDGYFLRAESFFNVASEIEILDSEPGFGPPVKNSYGGKSLHAQSHGESFMSLILNRFGGKGLYILDEPEAALSPTRQMALLSRIHQLVLDKSQFLIATHSPIILAYPNATIYQLTSDGLELVSYEETEHYKITKDFLNDYKSMLNILCEE